MNAKDILNVLKTYKYEDKQKTSEIQINIYKALKEKPNNVELLILLMQTQIMLEKKQDAEAVANKIWEEIDETDPVFYLLYVNNLINIGFVPMAWQSLKPFFEDLENCPKEFYPVLIKFATITGSLVLLSKLNTAIFNNPNYAEIKAYVEILQLAEYNSTLNSISKTIFGTIKEKVLSIEFLFFANEEDTRCHWMVYIAGDLYDANDLENKINTQITEYANFYKPQYFLAPHVNIFNISEHPTLE